MPASCGDARVGEAPALQRAQALRVEAVQRRDGPQVRSASTDSSSLVEEPRIDERQRVHVFRPTCRRGRHRRGRTCVPGPAPSLRGAGGEICRSVRLRPVGSSPDLPVSSPRSAFCSDSWKLRPIAITSPTDFIWVVRRRVGGRELLEREARDLGHHVIDRRLEQGRGLAAGDLVLQFVERANPRRVSRRPWRSSRSPSRPAPTNATRGVHFDDDHAPVRH